MRIDNRASDGVTLNKPVLLRQYFMKLFRRDSEARPVGEISKTRGEGFVVAALGIDVLLLRQIKQS